jgi:hypothetical protein
MLELAERPMVPGPGTMGTGGYRDGPGWNRQPEEEQCMPV